MPLLLGATTDLIASGRVLRLAGLPDFNADDLAFKITQFDGWFDGVEPDAVWVANGGGAGVIASGAWTAKEKAYLLGGRIFCDPSLVGVFRRLLLSALPYNAEAAITVLGGNLDPDQQVFVRCSAKPTMVAGAALNFIFTLTALDPFKYGLAPLVGAVGVYTGQTWYETEIFNATTSTWFEAYNFGANWYETFQQTAPSGTYPDSLTLAAGGDVASRRVTATVTGPLELGDWWLLNEATGDRLWADVALDVGQALAFDCQRELATLNGADISSKVRGDWLTLEPRGNLYRLVAGSPSNAFATIQALEAYL